MAGSIFGNQFRITTWGESHGAGLGVVIDGCPAGLSLSEEDIQTYLDRRKPGQSRFVTQRKESDRARIMSGVFEGKNLILIMVEAFDLSAIREDVTPTLYRLSKEGWYFDNYYTPKYSCTTGESEFIALTSIIPSSSVCTPNTYRNNNYSRALFQLFNQKGYVSTSYHNWNDEFYERKISKN